MFPPTPLSTDDHVLLDVPYTRQPDDVSCGPTCLYKVFRHYGDARTFDDVAAGVRRNDDGGTLGVYLAQAAVEMGYRVTIYSYNLRVFDPTWSELSADKLQAKLRTRAAVKDEPKLQETILAYADFLAAGGVIRFADLDGDLLVSTLRNGFPVICGLSATYLYQTAREDPITNAFDDVAGEPSGHLLVICGFEDGGARFTVSDPFKGLPMTADGTYDVTSRRLLNAILLGDVTYDGVLLVIAPKEA